MTRVFRVHHDGKGVGKERFCYGGGNVRQLVIGPTARMQREVNAANHALRFVFCLSPNPSEH